MGKDIEEMEAIHFKSFCKRDDQWIHGEVHTKIKLLKRISYGFRNVEVYVKKILFWLHTTIFPVLP